MTKHVVPMFESERGWGSKIDGYAGPFETLDAAKGFQKRYNLKNCNEAVTPDYYIKALDPVPYTGQTCAYKSTVDDDAPTLTAIGDAQISTPITSLTVDKAIKPIPANEFSFVQSGTERLRITADGELIFAEASEAAQALHNAWIMLRKGQPLIIEAFRAGWDARDIAAPSINAVGLSPDEAYKAWKRGR